MEITKTGGTSTIFKNVNLPKEITSCFPEAATFSKKDPTYEELRKMIVVLFSYTFFYNVEKNVYDEAEAIDNYDDYTIELNNRLEKAGMAPLYPGNPFDWLFCFCALAKEPLNTFRMTLDEARGIE